jgi:hypothetical protein
MTLVGESHIETVLVRVNDNGMRGRKEEKNKMRKRN